jgi:hypothetical protein
MKNGMTFYRTPLDKLVEKLSPEERFQILLDYDEFEKTGATGDSVLRVKAGEFYRELQGRESGFDAVYMMMVANSAYKISTIEQIENAQEIGSGEAKAALQLARQVASLPTLRENHIDLMAQNGQKHASTTEQLDDLVAHRKRSPDGDAVNKNMASERDGIIMEARGIIGLVSPSAEEQLAMLPDLVMTDDIPKVMDWDVEKVMSEEAVEGVAWVRVNHEHRLMTSGFTDEEGAQYRASAFRDDEPAYQSFRRNYIGAFPDGPDGEDNSPGM